MSPLVYSKFDQVTYLCGCCRVSLLAAHRADIHWGHCSEEAPQVAPKHTAGPRGPECQATLEQEGTLAS